LLDKKDPNQSNLSFLKDKPIISLFSGTSSTLIHEEGLLVKDINLSNHIETDRIKLGFDKEDAVSLRLNDKNKRIRLFATVNKDFSAFAIFDELGNPTWSSP
jgi:hypothetical protein